VIVSVLLSHPRPGSFNHALAEACAATLRALEHRVRFHDLDAEGFDPVLRASELASDAALDGAVARHCREIAEADGIVIVHPNWWGQPPAVMKGWIDRVLRAGVAYRFLEGDAGEGVPVGLLRARAAVVLNTSNTEPAREAAAFGDPLDALWRRCIFGLCGVAEVERRTFSVVVTSAAAQRAAWLDEARAIVARRFPADAPGASR
jgi:NAD(P)H dehydrogenase (quinone)